MAISQVFKYIIECANKDGNKQPIINELERLKAKNFRTYVTTLYSVKKLVKPEWVSEFTPSQGDLNKLTQDFPPIKHHEIHIDGSAIKSIIDNAEDDWKARLTYLLLVTGRRTMEIADSPIKLEDGKLFMIMSKSKNKEYQPIEILLNNDPEKTFKLINSLRFILKNVRSKAISSSLGVYLRKYGIKPHTLRGIYIRYLLTYRNDEKLSPGDFINEYLNHVTHSGASNSYDSIVIDNLMPYFEPKVTKKEEVKMEESNELSHFELGRYIIEHGHKCPGSKKDRLKFYNDLISNS